MIRAVAEVSKHGFVYVFNRVSGQPIWPIEEEVSGERASATRPVPSRPLALDRQGLSTNDLIDFTPDLHQQAEAILRHVDYGSLFSPPTERGMTIMPPYGRITAINLKTGDQVRMQPMGNGPRDHPAIRSLKLGRLGWLYRGLSAGY